MINGTYEILQIDGENSVKIITDSENEISKNISLTETELKLEQMGFGVRHLIFIRAKMSFKKVNKIQFIKVII